MFCAKILFGWRYDRALSSGFSWTTKKKSVVEPEIHFQLTAKNDQIKYAAGVWKTR